MLDQISIKYFKLVVDQNSIKKDTPEEVQVNCPVCGDKKHRLHLYRPKGFDQDVTHCFNSGCELAEKHHNIYNFLKIAGPEYLDAYKQETMFKRVNDIKTKNSLENSESLKEIIERVNGIKSKDQKKKSEIPLHKLFDKCSDHKDCIKYCKTRGFDPKDDWYFSTKEFFEYNGKRVYLKDYLLIPIYQEHKYRGFYSRSIKEKRFSTFLLPDTEKVWISESDLEPQDIEIITESIFDALSTGYQKSAAMLGASLSPEYTKRLNKNTIIALDNDKTGNQKSILYAEQGFRVFVPPEDYFFKDFNDALVHGIDIKKLIEENIFSSYDAIVRLKMKNY